MSPLECSWSSQLGKIIKLHNLMLKAVFLYGTLKEKIFMEQPRGFENSTKPDAVCRLHRNLYSLKQSPRCWNLKLVAFLKLFNFNQTESDHCVFSGKVNGEIVFLALYVDDGLLLSSSEFATVKVLKILKERFQITVTDAKQFVGVEIELDRRNRAIKIGQRIYIQKMLEKFRLENVNPVIVRARPGVHLTQFQCPKTEDEKKQMEKIPYCEAIGSLLFVIRVSRPDIEYVVNQASQFLNNYGHEHWQTVNILESLNI